MSRHAQWCDAHRRPFGAALACGLVHAIFLGLAFPPFGFWGCAFVAAAPVMFVALRTDRPWRSGLAVALGSAPMWAVHHAWTWEVAAAGMPGLVAYLSIWSGLFVPVAHAALRIVPSEGRWAALAVAWAGMEHLRGSVVGEGYPWFMLGHPVIDFAPLAAWGSVVGAMGVGFIIALGNGALACAAGAGGGKARFRPVGLGMVTMGLAIIIGVMGLSAPRMSSERTLRVGVVQTNMPQSNKQFATMGERFEAFSEWMGLTHELAQVRPMLDLIVWPETMFPGLALDEPALAQERDAGLSYRLDLPNRREEMPSTTYADVLLRAQGDWGIPMLVGAIGRRDFQVHARPEGGFDFGGDVFNSVVAIQGGEASARYDKVALTPFGEVMPYISAWPWLEKQLLNFGARGMSFDLSAGTGLEPLEIVRPDRTIAVATPVCFESTVSWACRGLAYERGERRADLIVNVTNDGWFGDWDGVRRHHLLHSRWRAVELGVPLVRSANTGISCGIDAQGQVIAAAAMRAQSTLELEIGLPEGSGTIYGRFGDVLGRVSAALTVVLGLAGAIAARRARAAQDGRGQDATGATVVA